VYSNDEHIVDLAQQINGRISARAQKHYPSNTVLIVNCETDGLILEDEWKSAIKQVESQASHTVFREVFIFASVGHHSASLWGSAKRRGRK